MRQYGGVFEGFSDERVSVGEVTLRVRRAGSGPPVMLLHGYPQTHVCWHRVAPRLAEAGYTTVVPDLRGYGGSDAPDPGTAAAYRKRVVAAELVELMRMFGHERFSLVGHDRGARVAYRLVLDHPDVVTRLALLDVIPTLEQFEASPSGRLGMYHWYFLAQPEPFPERLIGGQREFFLRSTLDAWCRTPGAITDEALAAYLGAFTDQVIAATCGDYRAGATVDCDDDEADRAAGRRIGCPLLVLWGARRHDHDLLEVWRRWALDVRGAGLDCGHFLPEEAPEDVVAQLLAFF